MTLYQLLIIIGFFYVLSLIYNIHKVSQVLKALVYLKNKIKLLEIRIKAYDKLEDNHGQKS